MSGSPGTPDPVFPALRLAEAIAAAVDGAVTDVLGHPCGPWQFSTDRRGYLLVEVVAVPEASPVEVSIRVYGPEGGR